MKWTAATLYAAVLVGFTLYLSTLDLEERDQTGGVVGTYVALLGVPTALVAVAQLWRRQRSTAPLDEVAAQLATAVRNQWDAEAALRRVNDPYPLPVSWRVADDDLAESWPLLQDMARAWPGGPPGDATQWPEHPEALTSEYSQIGTIFTDCVPTRRLLVLGEPGAGKSVLLMKLLQDLHVNRTADDPVPMLFSLATWNPDQPLNTWLADQLRQTHPGLRAPASTATTDAPSDQAEALLENRRILPLLDGFDEMPSDLHQRALDAINRRLADRQPLVLAARSASYRAALNQPGPSVRLNGAAAIQLLPLSSEKSVAYLRRDAGGAHTLSAARWDAVVAELGTGSPVGQALSTPLGLFLSRTIYNPRPGRTSSQATPHPDELCNTQLFPDRAAVDQHLFAAFIPAVYAPHGPHPSRWSPDQAHRTFVTLARFLENQRNGSPDLAWWEIRQAFPAHAYSGFGSLRVVLTVTLMAGLAAGLTNSFANGLTNGLMNALTNALAFGPAIGLTAGLKAVGRPGRYPETPRVRSRWSRIKFGIVAGTVTGFAAGLVIGLATGVSAGLIFGPIYGLMIGLVFGAGKGSDTPSSGPRWSPFRLGLGLATGIALGFVTQLAFVPLVHPGGENIGGGIIFMIVTGPGFGLGIGLGLGLGLGVWSGLSRTDHDLTSNIGPTDLLHSDRKTFITFWLGLGLAFGLTFGYVSLVLGSLIKGVTNETLDLMFGYFLSTPGLDSELGVRTYVLAAALAAALTIGLPVGAWFGLLAGLRNSAWPYFAVVRAYLAMRRKAPLALMSFLRDAHEHRGVLRQVGPVYQFRHIDLQRHLAQHHPSNSQHTSQRTPSAPSQLPLPRQYGSAPRTTDTP
ncbi:NACHT domain-containing protein [Streptomyces halstedii]|uniref:NACHT domain-containing protein n=1 Tax=Streptomyces halstedii TaxID=1944 RepID=UPI00345F66D6